MDNKNPYLKVQETKANPAIRAKAESLVVRVAERILQETSGQFRNRTTGDVGDKVGNWPLEDTSLDSGYNDWKYWNGVIHLALLQLSDHLNDQRYREQVIENYRFAFRHLDLFRRMYEKGIPDCPFHQFFRLDRLDDFGAMAAGLIEILEYEDNKQFREYLAGVMDYLLKKQDRLEDGTFCRTRFGITTLWADDLYMSVPFLVRMHTLNGEASFLEEAIRQSDNFHRRLFRPDNMLYHHCWYGDTGQFGVAHWSRANGWVMMARINLMEYLPGDHPYREKGMRLLLDQVVGLSRYQDHKGLWHQLIDKPDSFPETSGTSMFTYGIAKAVNRGWIPDHYASIALRAWQGMSAFVDKAGRLEGVSMGFNIRQDLPFYYNQPYESGGTHGLGAFLLAGLEVSKMKTYRDCVWC